jgi:hypothetical protein
MKQQKKKPKNLKEDFKDLTPFEREKEILFQIELSKTFK